MATSNEKTDAFNDRAPVSAYRNIKHTCRMAFLILQVCFGPLTFGYVIGFSSPALSDMQQQKVLTSSLHLGLFASLVTLGGISGSLIIGQVLDRIGRKWSLAISAVPAAIGFVLIAGSSSVSWLLIGRVLTGITCGMNGAATSVYLVEIAPTSMRGLIGSLNSPSITVGILLAYAVGPLVTYQTLAVIGCYLSLILALSASLPTMPESPRYLLQRQQLQEASEVLAYLRPSHYDAQEELRDMTSASELPVSGSDPSAAKQEVSIRELFTQPELSGPLFVALGLMALQQMSGINVVNFYAQSILNDTGAIKSPGLAACFIAGTQVVFTIISTCLMDKCGRRQFLLLASTIMMFSHLALGLFFITHSDKGFVAVTSLMLFIIGFSLGWGPVPSLIASEIFPTRARSSANSLAGCCSWLCSFFITETFPTLQHYMGTGSLFITYSGICLLGLCFVWKYLPETKGKSLEDLELFFIGTRSSSRSA